MNNSTCLNPHGFESPKDFFDCYRYFFINNIPVAIVEISFIALIALTNSLVIIKIAIFNKRPNKTIYDKIFLWLSSEYLITSLFAYPFFHIEELIGYWGFGQTSSLIWAVYDNNMNTFVSLLVLYLTYARYRSIQSSVNYLKEPIFRFPNRFICFFWVFGVVIWSIVVYFSKTYEYTTHVSYDPNILQFSVNAVMWFFPLLGVYIIGGLIIFKLNDLKRMNKAKLRSNLSSHYSIFKMANDPTARFSIIIVAFLVQWTVPCLFMLVETFLAERIDSLILAFKWSTYTVSFTDPILILIFCL